MQRRTFCAATAVMLGAGWTHTASAATKWDFATAYPAVNFHSKNNAQFVKDVAEATGGELDITTHFGASLFKMTEIKRAVQTGNVQMGEFFLVSFQNEAQMFGLDGLPFLARDYDEAYQLYQVQKPYLEQILDRQNQLLLYSIAWPPQNIYSNKEINKPDDLKGLKWRVYSPTTARIGELVGAQPVTIQEAELSQALATGVIEALITSSATGADNKLYEQLKYFYNVQAWIPKNAVTVNKKVFNALSEDLQQAVLQAAAAADERGWAASRAENDRALQVLKEGGMQVSDPSDELRAGLAQVGETVIQEWTQQAGADGQAVLDAFEAAKGA